jgi:hypothetical protein
MEPWRKRNGKASKSEKVGTEALVSVLEVTRISLVSAQDFCK